MLSDVLRATPRNPLIFTEEQYAFNYIGKPERSILFAGGWIVRDSTMLLNSRMLILQKPRLIPPQCWGASGWE